MISRSRPLLLGSASPRRSALIASLGLPFTVLPADIVEDEEPGERPRDYLERIASAKLAAVQARLEREGMPASAPQGIAAIVVADTTVVIDDTIVGKPADVQEAIATLTRLVGRTHTVLTRYVIAAGFDPGHAPPSPAAPSRAALLARTVQTEVKLRAATQHEVHGYAQTGEGLDKAGAYAAQGLGAFLVEGVTGSYTNVVGLPVCELVSDLQVLGLLRGFPFDLRAFDSTRSTGG
ncbi:MAG: Maf family nucleotide pyrophosphatase [Deltaproteobacteria bacterium]